MILLRITSLMFFFFFLQIIAFKLAFWPVFKSSNTISTLTTHLTFWLSFFVFNFFFSYFISSSPTIQVFNPFSLHLDCCTSKSLKLLSHLQIALLLLKIHLHFNQIFQKSFHFQYILPLENTKRDNCLGFISLSRDVVKTSNPPPKKNTQIDHWYSYSRFQLLFVCEAAILKSWNSIQLPRKY